SLKKKSDTHHQSRDRVPHNNPVEIRARVYPSRIPAHNKPSVLYFSDHEYGPPHHWDRSLLREHLDMDRMNLEEYRRGEEATTSSYNEMLKRFCDKNGGDYGTVCGFYVRALRFHIA